MNIQIEEMKLSDWKMVHSIHVEGVATGLASFAENAPDWEEWHDSYIPTMRFVARGETAVIGWAALSKVSSN